MIRFLVFILIILASCMVLLGATGMNGTYQSNQNIPVVESTSTVSQAGSAPTKTYSTPATLQVNWSPVHMAFICKILVLALIVFVAVSNYISFLNKREDF